MSGIVTTPVDSPSLSATFVYTGDQLTSKTDSRGTQTFGYDGSGTLTSVTGTGSHPSKTFSYSGGNLTAIVVS